jgi:hypothetical protein
MAPAARFTPKEAGRMLNLRQLRDARPAAITKAWAAAFPDCPMPRRHGSGPALLTLAEARQLAQLLQQQQTTTTR